MSARGFIRGNGEKPGTIYINQAKDYFIRVDKILICDQIRSVICDEIMIKVYQGLWSLTLWLRVRDSVSVRFGYCKVNIIFRSCINVRASWIIQGPD